MIKLNKNISNNYSYIYRYIIRNGIIDVGCNNSIDVEFRIEFGIIIRKIIK